MFDTFKIEWIVKMTGGALSGKMNHNVENLRDSKRYID
jgi:hypothetical protein